MTAVAEAPAITQQEIPAAYAEQIAETYRIYLTAGCGKDIAAWRTAYAAAVELGHQAAAELGPDHPAAARFLASQRLLAAIWRDTPPRVTRASSGGIAVLAGR